MTEQFANAASSTLNGTITSGATSLVVLSAASFPATGNFRILVEQEIMLVTAVSTNTFTVTRAQEGTSAVGHNSGVPVTHIITGGGLIQGIKDYAPYQPPQFANLTTDVAIHTSDPTYTDIVTVNATGTKFKIEAMGAGLADGSMTPRLRVLVDGVEQNYLGTYGTAAFSTGVGVQMVVLATITGLTNASHAFKLQGSFGGTTGWTIHANSNPTREAAWLIVTPLT